MKNMVIKIAGTLALSLILVLSNVTNAQISQEEIRSYLAGISYAGVSELPELNNMETLMEEINYPNSSRTLAEEGMVVLLVHVGTDGVVDDYRIMKSPSEALSNASVKVIDKMRFTPAKGLNGPMAAWTVVPIKFAINI